MLCTNGQLELSTIVPTLKDRNGGEKILIRLRPAHAPDTFYDEDHLIGTMLHEV